MIENRKKIALLGNPNSGKSSLFNQLTGLSQKVGNFPGITVDKKIGNTTLPTGEKIDIIDFPGLYSLHPNASDERLVVNILTNPKDENYPDLIVYVADTSNLERHTLLATQILDLGIPMIFVLNMLDVVEKEKTSLNIGELEKYLKVPVISVSSRSGKNIDQLKSIISRFSKENNDDFTNDTHIYKAPTPLSKLTEDIKSSLSINNDYLAKLYAHHYKWLGHLNENDRKTMDQLVSSSDFKDLDYQVKETMSRYDSFTPAARKAVVKQKKEGNSLTDNIDNIITHRIIGPLIFFAILFFVFQAVFAWSEVPMTLIEDIFTWGGESIRNTLPEAWYTDLLVDGVIAGLAGVMVFIPQITILFLLIAIMEESGYMARAVFMFDDIMQKFGLNGRSIVALVSSGACAIPAIMSTRTIPSWKERLNTILVSPLISCSARIPVYTVLVGFVVPMGTTWGFNNQGLAFMGLYLLGIVAALASAYVIKKLLKTDESSSLLIELPQYKSINWKNALLSVKEKVVTFIVEAGKVIFVISIILWFMASYGPKAEMAEAESSAILLAQEANLNEQETADLIASRKIEASYAGHIGKFIEPAIKPLGFDWKIGIALITSFAAREVFVGTMATIYSIGSADDEMSVSDKMAAEINPATGEKVYTPATALSLLIFYVFAMQCMSTLAVTKRETKSWKWPIIQFSYMSILAYVGSFIAYTLMS